MSDDRLKIAVFIDFDNIEIGVKSTLGTYFDIGAVLEAIKERGEIVTKIAYGDWTRAGDYGRSLSQHAVHMVQRNLTPGGDKNGADINLALDALEMAFTHNHINSFVIVSGDSDFISLVEKLKQYDRKVFVVGGRAFTSVVMQKNCTEFMAYENVVGRGRTVDRSRSGESPLAQSMPLVRRALKLLADREVLPQLGLLKSTLLQLDSAFSEREYGASSFRDFVQKLAKAGYVALKGNERSFHVELKEGTDAPASPSQSAPAATAVASPAHGSSADAHGEDSSTGEEETAHDAVSTAPRGANAGEAAKLVQAALARAASPRWPLYVRQVKQLIRAVEPQFDERKYGYGSIVEALKSWQREGLVRLERDRQGIVRVWPGSQIPKTTTPAHDVAEDPLKEGAPLADPSSITDSLAPESPVEDSHVPLESTTHDAYMSDGPVADAGDHADRAFEAGPSALDEFPDAEQSPDESQPEAVSGSSADASEDAPAAPKGRRRAASSRTGSRTRKPPADRTRRAVPRPARPKRRVPPPESDDK